MKPAAVILPGAMGKWDRSERTDRKHPEARIHPFRLRPRERVIDPLDVAASWSG